MGKVVFGGVLAWFFFVLPAFAQNPCPQFDREKPEWVITFHLSTYKERFYLREFSYEPDPIRRAQRKFSSTCSVLLRTVGLGSEERVLWYAVTTPTERVATLITEEGKKKTGDNISEVAAYDNHGQVFRVTLKRGGAVVATRAIQIPANATRQDLSIEIIR